MKFEKSLTDIEEIQVVHDYLNVSHSTRITGEKFSVSHVTVMRVLHKFGLYHSHLAYCPDCFTWYMRAHTARGRKKSGRCPACETVIREREEEDRQYYAAQAKQRRVKR